MNVYIAAPLFSEGERAFNEYVEAEDGRVIHEAVLSADREPGG